MLKVPALQGFKLMDTADIVEAHNKTALAQTLRDGYADYLIRQAVANRFLPSLNAINASECYVTRKGSCAKLPYPRCACNEGMCQEKACIYDFEET